MDKPPQCDTCGDYAPYGDARNQWLDIHLSRTHRIWWWLRRKIGKAPTPNKSQGASE